MNLNMSALKHWIMIRIYWKERESSIYHDGIIKWVLILCSLLVNNFAL